MKKTYVAGPLYWVIEYAAAGKVLSRAWMAEIQPPFRAGGGLRIRLGSRAFQVGRCRKSDRPLLRDVDASAEEIGQWA